jgi:outer membrane lipoprotein-sorting protein
MGYISFSNLTGMKSFLHFIGAVLLTVLLSASGFAQQSAKEVIGIADKRVRGESSKSSMKMTIVRPSWQREMTMKSWSKGDDLAIILITEPARDKGISFLKKEKELWNWQPSIDRIIKMPPSMMMQSWMGSDFTNDDLVKESSILDDYSHSFLESEVIDERDCYVIELIPNEDAPVVWGKIISWIDKEDYLQLKSEMYDEEGYLVNTMFGRNITNLGGKLLPSLLEIVPAEDEGHKTMVEYLELTFDAPMDESFFSIKNLKRVR